MDEALEELLAEIAGEPVKPDMPAWPQAGKPARPGSPRRPDGSLDCERMIREGKAMVAAIEAKRQAAYERHALEREYALRVYRQKQAEFATAQERFTLAASAWWDPPAPIMFW